MAAGEETTMSSSDILEAQSLLWNLSVNNIKSMSLKCAIELGIPDFIHKHGNNHPIPFSKLAASLSINPSKAHFLLPIMRLLSHSGFFAEEAGDQNNKEKEEEKEFSFSLTPASRLLAKAKPFFLFHVIPEALAPWQRMSDWLRNGDETLIETSDGRALWDIVAQEPRLGRAFHEAMASDSGLVAELVLGSGEFRGLFEGLESLVDVAGGTGTMGRAVAGAFPRVDCVVFDLPHVVAELKGSDNLRFVGGDMFVDPIPSAHAILLKTVLHFWDDERSVTILKKCREAIMKNGNNGAGKVIIIDMIIDDQQNMDKQRCETQLLVNVKMMITSGKVRNPKEWENLFFAAGFTHYKVIGQLGERSLIEAYVP